MTKQRPLPRAKQASATTEKPVASWLRDGGNRPNRSIDNKLSQAANRWQRTKRYGWDGR